MGPETSKGKRSNFGLNGGLTTLLIVGILLHLQFANCQRGGTGEDTEGGKETERDEEPRDDGTTRDDGQREGGSRHDTEEREGHEDGIGDGGKGDGCIPFHFENYNPVLISTLPEEIQSAFDNMHDTWKQALEKNTAIDAAYWQNTLDQASSASIIRMLKLSLYGDFVCRKNIGQSYVARMKGGWIQEGGALGEDIDPEEIAGEIGEGGQTNEELDDPLGGLDDFFGGLGDALGELAEASAVGLKCHEFKQVGLYALLFNTGNEQMKEMDDFLTSAVKAILTMKEGPVNADVNIEEIVSRFTNSIAEVGWQGLPIATENKFSELYEVKCDDDLSCHVCPSDKFEEAMNTLTESGDGVIFSRALARASVEIRWQNDADLPCIDYMWHPDRMRSLLSNLPDEFGQKLRDVLGIIPQENGDGTDTGRGGGGDDEPLGHIPDINVLIDQRGTDAHMSIKRMFKLIAYSRLTCMISGGIANGRNEDSPRGTEDERGGQRPEVPPQPGDTDGERDGQRPKVTQRPGDTEGERDGQRPKVTQRPGDTEGERDGQRPKVTQRPGDTEGERDGQRPKVTQRPGDTEGERDGQRPKVTQRPGDTEGERDGQRPKVTQRPGDTEGERDGQRPKVTQRPGDTEGERDGQRPKVTQRPGDTEGERDGQRPKVTQQPEKPQTGDTARRKREADNGQLDPSETIREPRIDACSSVFQMGFYGVLFFAKSTDRDLTYFSNFDNYMADVITPLLIEPDDIQDIRPAIEAFSKSLRADFPELDLNEESDFSNFYEAKQCDPNSQEIACVCRRLDSEQITEEATSKLTEHVKTAIATTLAELGFENDGGPRGPGGDGHGEDIVRPAPSVFKVAIPVTQIGSEKAVFGDEYNDPSSDKFEELQKLLCEWCLSGIERSLECSVLGFREGSIIGDTEIKVQSGGSTVSTDDVLTQIQETTPEGITVTTDNIEVAMVECPDDYCENGGICVVRDSETFNCRCGNGFQGEKCETISESGDTCPGGETVRCFKDPCEGTPCLDYPDAVCRSNYCGGCNAVFYVDKEEVDCGGCVDENGQSAADGETFRPPNSCVDCFCDEGRKVCPIVDCPPPAGPGCTEEWEEGACCPTVKCDPDHPGTEPVPRCPSLDDAPAGLDAGTCANQCHDDENPCRGNKKCCPTACGGTSCVNPVKPPADETPDDESPGTEPVPGCPSLDDAPEGLDAGTCANQCDDDENPCRGNKKCCPTACGGTSCVNPVKPPADETPDDEKPVDETLSDGIPSDETPSDEKPADETPSDRRPSDGGPSDDETDNQRPPADEKPEPSVTCPTVDASSSSSFSFDIPTASDFRALRAVSVEYMCGEEKCAVEKTRDKHELQGMRLGRNKITVKAFDRAASATCEFIYMRTEETMSADVPITLKLAREFRDALADSDSQQRLQLEDNVASEIKGVIQPSVYGDKLSDISIDDVRSGSVVIDSTLKFNNVLTDGNAVEARAKLKDGVVTVLKGAVDNDMLGSLALVVGSSVEPAADVFFDIRLILSLSNKLNNILEDEEKYERFKNMFESELANKLESIRAVKAVYLQKLMDTNRGLLVFAQVFLPPKSTVTADDIKEALPQNGQLSRLIKFDADSLKVFEPIIASECSVAKKFYDDWTDPEFMMTIMVAGEDFSRKAANNLDVIFMKEFSKKQLINFREAFNVKEKVFLSNQLTVKTEWIFNSKDKVVSGRVFMIPTVHGQQIYQGGPDKLCHGKFKFIAPRPNVEKAQFNDAGTAVLVTFSHAISSKTVCHELIQNLDCVRCTNFDTRNKQLQVSVTRCEIPEDFQIEFDLHAIDSSGQDYIEDPPSQENRFRTLSVQDANNPVEPSGIIGCLRGSKIQACSDENEIILTGKLRGVGVRGVECTWSVTDEAGNAVESIEFQTDPDTGHVCTKQTIMKDQLEQDKKYIFKLKVKAKRSERVQTSTFELVIESDAKPQISLDLKGAEKDNVPPGKDISISAKVEFPPGSACLTSDRVVYTWEIQKANGEKLEHTSNLNTGTRSLKLPANTLPAVHGETITIICKARREVDTEDGKAARASIELTIKMRPLVSHIQGSEELTIGAGSKVPLTLDGSRSHDPDDPDNKPTFSWGCVDASGNDQDCLSGDTMEVKMFDPSRVSIGSYVVTLTVSKSGRNEASKEVNVEVKPGTPPQVEFIPMDTKGDCYPASKTITIVAKITFEVDREDSEITIAVTDGSEQVFDHTLKGRGNTRMVSITIPKNLVKTGSDVKVQLKVNDGSEATDGSDVSIEIFYARVCKGVTGCQADVGEYLVGRLLTIEVTGCQAEDEGAYPLTYFVVVRYPKADGTHGNIRLSGESTEPVITGVIAPEPSDVKEGDEVMVDVIVNVKDNHEGILKVSQSKVKQTPEVTDEDLAALDESISKDLDSGTVDRAAGTAVTRSNLPTTNEGSGQRKKRNVDFNIYSILDQVTSVISEITPSEFDMVLASTSQVQCDQDNQDALFANVDAQLQLAEETGSVIDESTAQNLFSQIFCESPDDLTQDFLDDKKSRIQSVLKGMGREDTIGDSHTIDVGSMRYGIFRTLMSDIISPFDGEFSVNFGDELSEMYDTVERQFTGVEVITSYGGPSACPEGFVDPVKIEVYAESIKQDISGLTTPGIISLPNAPSTCLNPGDCKGVYCDPATGQFSDAGITTDVSDDLMKVTTTHLSEFNVIGGDGSTYSDIVDDESNVGSSNDGTTQGTPPKPTTSALEIDPNWPDDLGGAVVGIGITLVIGIIVGVLALIIIIILVIVVIMKMNAKKKVGPTV